MLNLILTALVLLNPPEQIKPDCVTTIYKIVHHETGNMNSSEVFRFMTEQILSDLNKIPCNKLTNWRWKIGNYPLSKVSQQVKNSVLTVLKRWPYREFPRCKFIGSLNDIKVWNKYGYNTRIGYLKTIGKLTVVGVSCSPLIRGK